MTPDALKCLNLDTDPGNFKELPVFINKRKQPMYIKTPTHTFAHANTHPCTCKDCLIVIPLQCALSQCAKV